MKRFWRLAQVGADGTVALDGRPVRTPGRAPLALPTEALAHAIAEEWNAVGDKLDPREMPLTGLANAAIDRVGPEHSAFAAGLSAYGESDLLCYRAAEPEQLADRQAAAWDPWLDWARHRYDVHFTVTRGIVHQPQPAATLARLNEAVAALDGFHLAGLSPIVTITGSLVLALALLERAGQADRIWAAANVDEDWQAEHWGTDPLAEQARASRRRDYDAGLRFLAMLD